FTEVYFAFLGTRRAKPGVLTENSVRSENAEVTIIRGMMAASTMTSVFVALFALVALQFSSLCRPAGRDSRPSSPTGRSPQERAASLRLQ
ncbi:MAG: hypothetical protein DMG69_14995, partial [Acidobacteria bacterium]